MILNKLKKPLLTMLKDVPSTAAKVKIKPMQLAPETRAFLNSNDISWNDFLNEAGLDLMPNNINTAQVLDSFVRSFTHEAPGTLTPKNLSAYIKLKNPDLAKNLDTDVKDVNVMLNNKDMGLIDNQVLKDSLNKIKEAVEVTDAPTPQELLAVNLYTKGYNTPIHTSDSPLFEALRKELDSISGKMKTREDLSLIRETPLDYIYNTSQKGRSRLKDIDVGDILEPNQFLSTSTNPLKLGFNPKRVRIVVPKGKNVIAPNKLNYFASQIPSEAEIILPKGAKYEVLMNRLKEGIKKRFDFDRIKRYGAESPLPDITLKLV